MKWVLLLSAIILEVCGTTSMKLSNGFSRFIPSLAMFFFYAFSLVVLNIALKHIPIGIAYAIWSALGTVLIVSIGVVYFKESLTLVQISSITLILIGVAGLNLGGSHSFFR